jgi:hypothetical protein
MKVSMDGNLEDLKLEEGKKIVEAIYNILYSEWYPMKEKFEGDYFEYFAIYIFWQLLLGDPAFEELIDMVYEEEIEYSFENPSRSRCEKIAFQIRLLKPWVVRNANYTDDPNVQK